MLTPYKMPTMNVDWWIFLLALCFICVSSNGKPNVENSCKLHLDDCETSTLSAPLGSSVLLQCIFSKSSLSWVSWAQTGVDIVQLSSEGRIKFLDHRYGRVKAFPNQGSERNYSICIDELSSSDLGCYRCEQGRDCLQVELVAEAESGAVSKEMRLLIYIFVGVAAFILLSIGGYCCIKCIMCCKKKATDNANNPEGAGTEGASAAPEKPDRVPVDQQQRGAGNDNLVYENDDQDPSNQQSDLRRNYCSPLPEGLPDPNTTHANQSTSGIYPNLDQFERKESQRTKQRFHRELFNRLRQASFSQHYYVNRDNFKQQAMSTQAENHHRAGRKKKAKENHEFKNPIYNRSMDQLNHL